MQRRAATLGCASLSASGMGVLGYQHFESLQPYLLDITGFGLLGAAAIIGNEVFGKKSTPAAKKGGWQCKLVPLHDEARYAAAIAALSDSAGKDKAPAGPLDEALASAEKAAAKKAEEAKAERSAVLLKEVADELAAGAAPRRVRQRLAPRVFVIDFDTRGPARGGGDAQPPKPPPNMRAMLETLREQVGLLLHVASPYDEVVLRVTSPGGAVMDYGLAAALFARLKATLTAAGVRTTACVDLVAASGGYMLACTAHTIVAAPFAMVGSIGVIAGAPNVAKLLERGGVDYVQRTGGAHKRTINVFTPNTEEGLQKFEEEIDEIHRSFMSHASAAGGDTPAAVSAPQGDAQMSQRFLEARRVFLNGAVNDESANRLVAELLYLEAASPGTPIDLYINSSGGSLWGGFAVYDTMRAISSPVRTICIGRCRSMAAVLLAAGEPGERYAAASARLMIHQPSWSFDSHDGAASKSATNVTAEAAECEAQRKHWAATLAVLTGRDAAELDARMAHDHYLTAEEARELGIVDRLLRSVVASTVADGKPGVEGVPEKPSSP